MVSHVYDNRNIKAIIGLGNPGFKYYKTRHSVGFRIVDVLVEQFGASWKHSDLMEHAQINLNKNDFSFGAPLVYVIKPITYMNNSGQVLSFLLKKGIKPEEVLVIHDELEKSFGFVGLRWNGGTRGHNGLRSIVNIMGKDFWHLQIGIGRPEDRNQVGDYVLTNFSLQEELVLDDIIAKSLVFIMND